jgi:tetraprenyl-beta-curcumene synthase
MARCGRRLFLTAPDREPRDIVSIRMGSAGEKAALTLEGIALVSALTTYRRQVLPRVRKELGDWGVAAEAIPDPLLREAGLSALREKKTNAEATAVFAILAPRARRRGVVQAMTALQVAIDYLDTLGEQSLDDPLASGLMLHRALVDAVSPRALSSDWYSRYPRSEDGGYLAALVARCRCEFTGLPAHAAVQPAVQRTAVRCGEGQSHAHASVGGQSGLLEDWARRQDSPPGYTWWEVAAGASSSVAIHALIAAGADPRTDAEEAELIEAAYFPPIGALTVLLDDLIDLEEDTASGEHNYLPYYRSNSVAADRLALIAHHAKSATKKLRHRHRHAAILAGVAGFYLSAPKARSEYASPIRERMLQALGTPAKLVMATRRASQRG